MANSTDTEVYIGGRVLTLSGTESEEYLHKVASYLNNKITELNKSDSYRKQTQDMQSILLSLNISDDLFKAKAKIAELEGIIEEKEKELYNLKHEYITSQIKLENTEKNLKNSENALKEANRKLSRFGSDSKN